MKPYEFAVRLVAKLLLIASVFALIIGGFAVENDMALAVRLIITGLCMAVPDVIINIVDSLHAEELPDEKNKTCVRDIHKS